MSLTIDKLTVTLQKDEILHGIDLHIEDGEFVSLLGESGCGKSTLLKSVAGLNEIKEGDILVDGESVLNVPPEKRGTVIVFQDLRLFPHMTVERNIAFPMELRGVPAKERKQAVDRLLKEVQLSGYADRKIRRMSGGQLQRVALARALAAEPKVLLLDEPFSGLDERLRSEMEALVSRLHRERKITTVLVTHDKQEALKMSDRIALMHDGRILQYDTPHNIFYHPVSKKTADYFGKANYIDGAVRSGVFKSKELTLQAKVGDGNYMALIRPASVKLDYGSTQCSVSDINFMGETAEVVLDTPFGEMTSLVMSSELQQREVMCGKRLGIWIEEAAVSYFPKE